MFPQPGGQGQLPPTWNPPTSQQPPNGSYPPQPHINPPHPPPHPQEPRPDMTAHQHPHPHSAPPYHLPGPPEWGRGPPPPDHYRAQPPQAAQQPPLGYMNHAHQPPAPRQRTAIACRYCRRRKIRCSGFENTDDGRCINCSRFNQDCIFTPVSAQTQAFVPAHTVWRGVGHPPPLYGAFGQPLRDANPPNGYQQQPPPRGQQYLASPTSTTGPYPAHSASSSSSPPQSGAPYDDGSREALARKRPHEGPHETRLPILPPPKHGPAAQLPRIDTGPQYTYADPTSLTSTVPSAPSSAYPAPPPAPSQQPYYAAQAPRRASPQSAYSYGSSRTSLSPHTQTSSSTSSAPSYYPPPQQEQQRHSHSASSPHTLQPLPPRSEGRTPPPPPPAPPTSSRPGMRINDLVDTPSRTSTDADMLNALNRRVV